MYPEAYDVAFMVSQIRGRTLTVEQAADWMRQIDRACELARDMVAEALGASGSITNTLKLSGSFPWDGRASTFESEDDGVDKVVINLDYRSDAHIMAPDGTILEKQQDGNWRCPVGTTLYGHFGPNGSYQHFTWDGESWVGDKDKWDMAYDNQQTINFQPQE